MIKTLSNKDASHMAEREEHALNRGGLRSSTPLPYDDMATVSAFGSIVTNDRKMLSIFRYIEAIAPTSQSVMITGETGTGKELIARALHEVSRRNGEFVSVNVAGLEDFMFSDTLFGHSRGAFTGAERERKGLIEKAAGGTLFLDEIGDLNNNSQVKLLRLLQEGEYYAHGSDKIKVSNARIIVATNSDLEEKMNSGVFRKDLFYRLCSHHIHIPSLRERIGDIPLLVEHFLADSARILGRAVAPVAAETLDILSCYDFPGNVRELKGLISNAATFTGATTLTFKNLKHQGAPLLPDASSISYGTTETDCTQFASLFGRQPTLQEAEDYLIKEALKASCGNQRAASAMLGISRQALNKRLQRNPTLSLKASSVKGGRP